MAVAVTVTEPFAPVIEGIGAKVALWPKVPAVGAKVTVTFGTPFPPESFTVATRAGKL